MKRIVECVPNISDGQRPEVYTAVAKACEGFKGVKLLDVDPGKATNRTVITFAGPPESMVDAAFALVKCASGLIDMRTHTGEHPRMGAVDVCPFVPVSGVTLDECADLARRLGRRVGEELGLWVYLYEKAATRPEWENLANIRKGEYESLAARVHDAAWRPDFGHAELDPRFGAMAVGARKFLVAYNINLNAPNKKVAQDIAFNIRESGRSARRSYPDGDILRNPDGSAQQIPGLFKHCKSTGWVIPEYKRAQITMNLTDIDVTPVHVVFDEVVRQAAERGARVTGSEIVGLVPFKAIHDAGVHFLRKQGLSAAVSQEEIIDAAVLSLGLGDVVPFNPAERIVEYRLAETRPKLVDMTLTKFADTLASNEPAPGGGSTAALCGALASALGTMVTNLTHGKPDFRPLWEEMEQLGIKGQAQKSWFVDAVDRDTDSFNLIMDAMKLPKATDEEKRLRDRAIEAANKEATLVPLGVLEKSLEVVGLLEAAAAKGNPNCASDAGVGLYCLLACAHGAALNVRINLKGIKDDAFKGDCLVRLERALGVIEPKVREIMIAVNKNL